jgi:hypothetical protein
MGSHHRQYPRETNYCAHTRTWRVLAQASDPYIIPVPTFPAITFAEYITRLEEWEQERLQYTEITTDPTMFCIRLAQGLRAVSDGSVRYNSQRMANEWLNVRARCMVHILNLSEPKDMACCHSFGF